MLNLLKKKSFILFFFFLVVNIASLILYQKIKNIEPRSMIARNESPENKEYELKPISSELLTESPISYPSVTISPDDNKYYIVELLEKLGLSAKTGSRFHFANKRISELEKWKEDINWQKGLSRYQQQMKEYLLKSPIDYLELRQTLNAHTNKVLDIIWTSGKSSQEKQRLYFSTEKIFGELNSNISKNVPEYTPNGIQYPLNDVFKADDWGIYDVEVKAENIAQSFKAGLQLHVGEDIYSPVSTDKDDPLFFKNVKISRSGLQHKNFITLKISNINLIGDIRWYTDKSYGQNYNYYFYLPKLQDNKYLLKLVNKLDVVIQIQQRFSIYQYDKKNKYYVEKINSDYPLDNIAYPFPNENIYKKIIELSHQDKYLSSQFNLISKIPIDYTRLINDFKIEIYPVWEPEITFMKTANTEEYYLSKNKEKIDFQKKLLSNIWLLSLFSLILVPTARILLRLFLKLSGFMKRVISFVAKKLKWIFLISSFIGIIWDIFYFQSNSDVLRIILMSLWILAIVGFQIKSKASYLLTLLFLIIFPLLLIFKKYFFAERMAVWAYLMLAIGAIHSVVAILTKTDDEGIVDFAEFKLTGKIIASKALLFTKSLVEKIFNLNPKTIADYIVNLIKLAILTAVTVIIFYLSIQFYVFIDKKIAVENLKKLHLSLTPVIAKIEPGIAYPATKVIVFGKGFNSRAIKKAILRGRGVTIVPDFWDENKIVFTIPLDWKSGVTNIWIEKPIIWNNKIEIAKSNVVNVKLIPVSPIFTPADDEYFKQLPTLDNQTLEINGYQPHEKSKVKNKKIFLSFYTVFLVVIVTAGFWLRLKGITDNHSFWSDEAFVSSFGRDIVLGEKNIFDGLNAVWYQPFQILTTAIFFKLFGISEFSARLPSVLFSTVGIIFAFLTTKRLSNWSGGLLASFLISFSQLNLANSTQAKPYMAIQTFTLIIIYLLLIVSEDKNFKKIKYHISIVICIALATLYHIIGLLLLIPYFIFFIFISYKISKRLLIIFLLSLSLVTIIFLTVVFPFNKLAFLLFNQQLVNNTIYLKNLLLRQYGIFFIPSILGLFLFFRYYRGVAVGVGAWILLLLVYWNFKISSHNIRYLVPLFGIMFVFSSIFWARVGEYLNLKFLPILVLIVVYLSGYKIVRFPQVFYSANADFYGDVQIADYKTTYKLLREKIPNYKQAVFFNDDMSSQRWYMPEKPVDIYLKKGFGGTMPEQASDGKPIYHTLNQFLQQKIKYKKGILIVEDWESLLPEDIKQYAKKNMKLEIRVEGLKEAPNDPWPLEVYSWGMK